MIDTKEQTIGEWVAADYRAAGVFKKFGIDFCCKGNRSIQEACGADTSKYAEIMDELQDVTTNNSDSGIDFQSWPIDLLTDYIEKKHHRYIEEKTPVLKQYLHKIKSVHGREHAELELIEKLFNDSSADLAMHMKKEELVLFPFIRKMVSSKSVGMAQFGSVENPVQMLRQEHETEGDRFGEMARISNNFTPPADGCNTYKVAFALLKEFENDLHLHIHLENNILFPKALAMEKKLGLTQ